MPRFAANLSMMYQEVGFLDRFAAAAADGFQAVEFLFPYAHPAEAVAAALRASGVRNVLFNLPPGDWDRGERGMAALPGREAEFAASIDLALTLAVLAAFASIAFVKGAAMGQDEPPTRDDAP